MTKENVIEVLAYFKNIDKEIEFNNRIMKDLEEQYYYPIGAINMDGMPKASGSISRPTESTALHVPETLSEYMKELEAKNKSLCELKVEVLKEINSLAYTHKYILFNFYLGYEKYKNRNKWVQISEQINYSERQCKNIRDDALDQLRKKFEQNSVVSKHTFS